MTEEKKKQFFQLAEELYAEELYKVGLKCPPVYVNIEDEHNLVVISCIEEYSDIIKDHLKNVLTEAIDGE